MTPGTTYQKLAENYTDEQICQAVRNGGAEMEYAVRYLVERGLNRDQITAFIRARKGSREDAEDILQEAMRSLILGIRSGKFRGEGSIQAYVFSICRNLWYKRFQKIQREQDGEMLPAQEAEDAISPEAILLDAEQQERIRQVLSQTGSKCLQVLELWQMGYSMREIAEQTGYKGEHVARKKKAQCFRKLLDLLDEQPGLLRMLKEMKWNE